MALLEKYLIVKRSTLPAAGKGLFAKTFIPKGTRIVEYKGKISTWKDVEHDDGKNPYIFYVKRDHVIDARSYKKALARYANDARGLTRVKGVRNNSTYETSKGKVYIRATRDIAEGEEILVEYGKEYWDVIRYNKRLERQAI